MKSIIMFGKYSKKITTDGKIFNKFNQLLKNTKFKHTLLGLIFSLPLKMIVNRMPTIYIYYNLFVTSCLQKLTMIYY